MNVAQETKNAQAVYSAIVSIAKEFNLPDANDPHRLLKF